MANNNRIPALDIFRGLTIALMIIVNSPGNQTPYKLLQHASWNGCSFADIVFPFFMVIVGISLVLALSNKEADINIIFWRSSVLFLIGLLLNVFPNHFDLASTRIMGVLQRIAICYFVSALLYLKTSIKIQALICFGILIGYAFMRSEFVIWVDNAILGSAHLYTKAFDPEGLVSTLPAISSVLIGNLVGHKLLNSDSNKAFFYWIIEVGCLLCVLGFLSQNLIPWNKSLWSSSYVLWTAGLAALSFGVIYFCTTIKSWSHFFCLFDVLGKHALLIYVLHVVGLKLQALIHIHAIGFRYYLTDLLFGMFKPENAALSYAAGYLAFWIIISIVIDKGVMHLRQQKANSKTSQGLQK